MKPLGEVIVILRIGQTSLSAPPRDDFRRRLFTRIPFLDTVAEGEPKRRQRRPDD
jgi:hypothetical protein